MAVLLRPVVINMVILEKYPVVGEEDLGHRETVARALVAQAPQGRS